MRKLGSLFSRPGHRHSAPRTLGRIVTSGFVVLLSGGLVVLAAGTANLEDAIRQQQARVAEHPSDARGLTDLGNLLALAGDLTAAEDTYRQAIAIAPDLVSAHYNLALVLMQTERKKEALKNLHTALELDPGHAWSHYQMGTLMAEQRNRNQAVRHYAEAFRLDRSLTSPKVNPHIVENHLATEALLTTYAKQSHAAHAPRVYEEPGHIAELLLPTEPIVEAAPEAADDESAPAADEPAPPRKVVLEERSVSPRRTTPAPRGQAVGSTDAASDSQVTVPRTSSEDADELDSTATDPRRLDSGSIGTLRSETGDGGTAATGGQETPGSSSGTRAPAPDSPSAGQPLGSPRTYIPGVQSTGRLEIELLPVVESAPTVSSS